MKTSPLKPVYSENNQLHHCAAGFTLLELLVVMVMLDGL